MRISKEHLVPPGTELKRELYSCLLFLLTELLGSLWYLYELFRESGSLYYLVGGKKYLVRNAVMPALNEMLRGKMFGIWIVLLGVTAMAAGHYASFYRESKSIYLMKRLPDPLELHRRCLTLPVLCLAAGAVLLVLLLTVDISLYYLLTPASCLPVQEAFDFWRCIL